MDVTDLVARHRAPLAAAGVALLVLGAWMCATAYATPVETRETREVSSWSERSAFTYAVPVTRNSTHWPIGTVLPMGHPAYFRTISDSIHVEHTWTPSVADDTRGLAAGRMVVQVQAQDRAGRAYWSIEHTLAQATTEDVSSGLALSGVVDLDALTHEVAVLNKEAPLGDGTLNWSVRTRIVYALETPEGRVQGETLDVLPIAALDPRFSLPSADELTWERPHARTETLRTSAAAGMDGVLRNVRGLAAAAGGLSLLGLALVAGGARNDAFDREYRRHRDWVSVAGAIPEAARDGGVLIDVSTLDDLVHIAADARTRVLLDARTREFYALLPNATYRYARHAATPAAG